MISILIPVFNFDIRHLVNDLVQQCKAAGILFEVLCFDDGSEQHYKKLHQGQFEAPVIYREMPENIGRAAIRNALADAAVHPYLLFMDCDSKVVSDRFIQNYLDHLSPSTLLYGGRCYEDRPPVERSFMLHWKYGRQREQKPAADRMRQPWHSFMTNNFLVPKSFMSKIRFDETLKQYGHEDTLFGLQLARAGVQIKHLDNPLEHLGLEPSEVFLQKTELGLQNLQLLRSRKTVIATRLLTLFDRLQQWRLTGLAAYFFKYSRSILQKQLFSKSPNLHLFDLYKLGYFCWWNRQQHDPEKS